MLASAAEQNAESASGGGRAVDGHDQLRRDESTSQMVLARLSKRSSTRACVRVMGRTSKWAVWLSEGRIPGRRATRGLSKEPWWRVNSGVVALWSRRTSGGMAGFSIACPLAENASCLESDDQYSVRRIIIIVFVFELT